MNAIKSALRDIYETKDLLGFLENEANAPCRKIITPFGAIQLVPAELVIVERILSAYYPAPDTNARDTAKKMMAVCLKEQAPVDWKEVERLARLPAFGVTKELRELKAEVSRELETAD